MEITDLPLEECKDSVKADKMEKSANECGITIACNGLEYTYPDGDKPVVSNASFKAVPGETIAFIGPSGEGKTTLLRLILGLAEPQSGEITVETNDGQKISVSECTRRFCSYVPQGNTLFSGSIRENILMGKLDASEEEIWEALKLSSGFEFVKGLPKGLDTVIGERGHGLSEGQAQRIAIARAFIRKAPFLVLDEATSALDEQTELKVIEGLQQLEPRPTCLVITHRKSILAYCDREITIESKRVSE